MIKYLGNLYDQAFEFDENVILGDKFIVKGVLSYIYEKYQE